MPPLGPLSGLRVIDFTSFIAGSYCAQLLGDLGATVVKVESTAGDAARHWGPFLKGESRFFQGWNRNKRSIAVDLQSEQGRAIVHDLVRTADMVVENFRPGITAKLGIDYESIKLTNPKILYLSITAFGARGPYGKRPGYDPILQSLSGAARGNVRYCKNTGICSVAVSDYGAALLGVNGLLAALYHRERTGMGQKIETSLLQAVMAVQSHMFVDALEAEEEPPFGIFPYSFFETADDILFIAAGTDRFWQLLCRCLDAPELAADERYGSNRGRVAHTEALTKAITARLAAKTTKEWEEILLEAGVPCAPAQTYDQFFDDPQVHAMDMFPTLEHDVIGPIRQAGVPIHFEKSPGAVQGAAPALGQHTAEILEELGYGQEAIDQLKLDGHVV